jgi:RHS repeat-associated protein
VTAVIPRFGTVHPDERVRGGVRGQPAAAWSTATQSTPHAQAGDIAAPGDYNGDGNATLVVYRPSTGQWIDAMTGAVVATFGQPNDIPAPGDYDGDGTTEVAVYRPSAGQWLKPGVVMATWGWSTDVPVPGDYDGDGDDDIAVFRPGTGQWWVRGHNVIATYGQSSGDIPAPGDYDGDRTSDVTIFRPSLNQWHSSGTQHAYTWDKLDRLASVTVDGISTTMVYAPGGQRLISRRGTDVELFLGGFAERHLDDGRLTEKRYYTIGSTSVAVATKVGAATTTYDYLFGDARGSTNLTARSGSTTVNNQWYTPYGRIRGADSTLDTTTRAYIGQHQDPTSLHYLNNRYHDPQLGVFISVDPLVQMTGEPYIYASGNPTTLSDPTGLFSSCTLVGSGSSARLDCANDPDTTQKFWEAVKVHYDLGPDNEDPFTSYGFEHWDADVQAGARAGHNAARMNSQPLPEAGWLAIPFLAPFCVALCPAAAGSVASSPTAWAVGGFLSRLCHSVCNAVNEMFGGPGATNTGYVASKINITDDGLRHVFDRHLADGARSAGKSVFNDDVIITRLIADADAVVPVPQGNGNLAYIVDAGRTIGIDRASGQATNVYTVITKPSGNLVTAFPGVP